MTIVQILLLGSAAWFLWRGYIYLFDKDKAWQIYVDRQKRLRKDLSSVERNREWDTVATVQGIIFTGLAVFGIIVALRF